MRPARIPDTLRAAWWAARALRFARRSLRTTAPGAVTLSAPPRLPAHAAVGVRSLLRLRRATCLERSLVNQRWLLMRGEHRDVVIGVTAAADFRAHAWLEGEPTGEPFHELARFRP